MRTTLLFSWMVTSSSSTVKVLVLFLNWKDLLNKGSNFSRTEESGLGTRTIWSLCRRSLIYSPYFGKITYFLSAIRFTQSFTYWTRPMHANPMLQDSKAIKFNTYAVFTSYSWRSLNCCSGLKMETKSLKEKLNPFLYIFSHTIFKKVAISSGWRKRE